MDRKKLEDYKQLLFSEPIKKEFKNIPKKNL